MKRNLRESNNHSTISLLLLAVLLVQNLKTLHHKLLQSLPAGHELANLFNAQLNQHTSNAGGAVLLLRDHFLDEGEDELSNLPLVVHILFSDGRQQLTGLHHVFLVNCDRGSLREPRTTHHGSRVWWHLSHRHLGALIHVVATSASSSTRASSLVASVLLHGLVVEGDFDDLLDDVDHVGVGGDVIDVAGLAPLGVLEMVEVSDIASVNALDKVHFLDFVGPHVQVAALEDLSVQSHLGISSVVRSLKADIGSSRTSGLSSLVDSNRLDVVSISGTIEVLLDGILVPRGRHVPHDEVAPFLGLLEVD
jgi:hypothetical protein